jgi:YVTN family beta-propeller protein
MVTDPRIGTEIAGYRIESVLGRGGMGVVYVARHLRLDRTVALKVVSPELAEDPKFRDRFVRESRLAASLEHPNIVPIHDAGEADGVLYLAMRLVQGTDLKSLISEDGGLDPARTVKLLDQVAGALDAAHQAGLVHRDVKPGNVLVASPGTPGEHAYLSDFGLTKRMTSDSGLTGTGQFVGTLDYAAPEQFEGKQLDGRADVYSLGCVLYECLTGEIPYRRDNQAALVYAHLMAEPPKVTATKPGLPGAIDDVVAKGMAKKPEDRYATAGELIDGAKDALGEAASAGARTTGPTVIAPPTPPSGLRRLTARPARIAIAAVLVLAIALGAFVLLSKGGAGKEGPSTASTGGGATAGVAGKDRVVRIDLATRRIVSIPVGKSPSAVAVSSESVWVANANDGTVSRIDPANARVTAVIRVGRGPQSIAIDGGMVWVANELSNSVSMIDPGTNEAVTIPLPGTPVTVAAADGVVLVGIHRQPVGGPGTDTPVLRIDEESRAASQGALVPGGFDEGHVDVAGGYGAGWAGSDAGILVKMDPATGRSIGRFVVGQAIAGLAVGQDGVWVASYGLPAQVRLVDPLSGQVTVTVPVGTTQGTPGSKSISMVEGRGSLWVANADEGTVSQVDLTSNVVVRALPIGKTPTGVALGFNSLWVAVDAS